MSQTHSWAVGLDGIIVTTADGGANWSSQISSTSNGLQAIVYDGDSTLWVVGGSGRIYRYFDRSFPPPVANDSAITVVEDSTNNMATLPITDVNNDSLNYTIISGPTKGTLSGTAPNLLYTPNPNFPHTNANGSDAFTFKASDEVSDSNTATMTITVSFVNDPPISNNQSVVVLEDSSNNAITLTATDAENDNFTYNLVSQPAHGTLAGTAPNLTYTPNSNFPSTNANGTDSFTFKTNGGTGDSNTATITVTVTPVNDLPIVSSQSVTVAEDSSNNAITLTATDADNDTLTYTIVDQPTHGTLAGTTPNLAYTPTPNFPSTNANGTDTFTFIVNDGTGDSNTATITITVTPVNDLPIVSSQSVTVAEDSSNNAITLTATDADNDTLTYTIVDQPTHGTLAGATPNLTYTPTPNFPSTNTNGTDTFTFIVNDGTEDSSTAAITITVTPISDTPVAYNLIQETAEDSPTTITMVATDADNDILTYIIVSQPNQGILSLVSGSDTTYTPNANYFGTDTFQFKVNDGTTESGSATVTITINSINDDPIATNLTMSTKINTSVAISLFATDPETDNLTYQVTSQPSNGKLLGSPPIRTLTYTPNTDYSGIDSFTFKANDGFLDSNIAIVSIKVNIPPVATDVTAETQEDKAVSVILAATDNDNDSLTFSLVIYPKNGTASISGSNLTYTPKTDYNGKDTFLFLAKDAAAISNTASVSIDVIAVNDTPIANSQSITTSEDTTSPITLTASDIDGDKLNYSIISNPNKGTLTGKLPKLTYAPDTNFTGDDTFTFVARDTVSVSQTATVNITVEAINDVPTAHNQSITILEDTVKPITLTAEDPDNSSVTYALVTLPTNGTLAGTPPDLTYTPNPDFDASDTFTFVAKDTDSVSPAVTVSIVMKKVNDVPVANNQSITVAEESNNNSVTLTATDADNTSLTFTIVSYPTNGTLSGTAPNLTYTPNLDFNGNDTFKFITSDGTLVSQIATVNITVTPTPSSNQAPIAENLAITTEEDTQVSILLQASDANIDSLTYTIVSNPTNGASAGTAPSLTYTPNSNYNGTDSLAFKVNDGTVDSNIATVTITVTPVNDLPVANGQDATTSEDTSKSITLTATDIDNETLTYIITSSPSNGTLSGTLPSLTYTAISDFNGNDSFSFIVDDSKGLSSEATVNITIDPVNDPPIPNSQSLTTSEDTVTPITLTASDLDGDRLTYTVTTNPNKGILSGTAPNLTYTPNSYVNGNDTFTFIVSDSNVISDKKTVSIQIDAANNPPTANKQALTILEDEVTPITLTGDDTDNDTLAYTVTVDPTHGTLSGTVPNLVYTPHPHFNGDDTFSFVVNDGISSGEITNIELKITSINDAPISHSQTVTMLTKDEVSITLTGDDFENDPLTYVILSQVTKGILSGSPPNLTYIPNQNFSGTDEFTFNTYDGLLSSNTATIFITLNTVIQNSPPVAKTDTEITVTEDEQIAIKLFVTDINSNSLIYTIISQPKNGTLSGTPPVLIYKPNENYNGTDNLIFKANDGELDSNTATINITVIPVNDQPIIPPDAALTLQVVEDSIGTPIKLAAIDHDGDELTYHIVSYPINGTLSGKAPELTYTPHPNFSKNDAFSFQVNDGTVNSEVTTIAITVTPINDTPNASDIIEVFAQKSIDNPVWLTCADLDDDKLTYAIVSYPQNGKLSTLHDNLTKYTPNPDFVGHDTFTFKANDGRDDSNLGTVSITVSKVLETVIDLRQPIHPPVIVSVPDGDVLIQIPEIPEQEKVSVSVKIAEVKELPLKLQERVRGTVLEIELNTETGERIEGNFTKPMTIQIPINLQIPDPPNTIALTTKIGDQMIIELIPTMVIGSRPNQFLRGELKHLSYVFAVSNKAPTVAGQHISVNEDVEANEIILKGKDEDGDSLTYIIVDQPVQGTLSGSGENWAYTPESNIFGSDKFTVQVNDGASSSGLATVTIDIQPINDKPIAHNQQIGMNQITAVQITLAGEDIDEDPLTYTIESPPVKGKLSGSGRNHIYTPNQDFDGIDSFTFQTNDGKLSSEAATITITAGTITLSADGYQHNISVLEDSSITIRLPNQHVTDREPTYEIISLPQYAKEFSLIGTTVIYQPKFNFHGIDAFTLLQETTKDTKTPLNIKVKILSLNDIPVAINQVEPGVVFTVDTASITLKATDSDSKFLIFEIVDPPKHGELRGTIFGFKDPEKPMGVFTNQNGMGLIPGLVYKPDESFAEHDSLTFKVNDGETDSNIATVKFVRTYNVFYLSIPSGINLVHLPLRIHKVNDQPKPIKTVGDLYDVLGEKDLNFITTYDTEASTWRSYLGERSRGKSSDRRITQDLGLITIMKHPVNLKIEGIIQQVEGQSYIDLRKGINLVGIPVKDDRTKRVSDLLQLDGLINNITSIIVSYQGNFKVVAQQEDEGDHELKGGQAFITVAQNDAKVDFHGTAWSNTVEDLPSAPQTNLATNLTDQSPVLVIDGILTGDLSDLNQNEIRVTAQNLANGLKVSTNVSNSNYSLTLMDLQSLVAVQVGDFLKISGSSNLNRISMKPITYTITAEDISKRQISVLPLVLYRIPTQTTLLPNYPNPFNPETWIPFRLAKATTISLSIHDIHGNTIRHIDLNHLKAGIYESKDRAIYWDGRNKSGEYAASGVYFYTLRAGNIRATQKMILMK